MDDDTNQCDGEIHLRCSAEQRRERDGLKGGVPDLFCMIRYPAM